MLLQLKRIEDVRADELGQVYAPHAGAWAVQGAQQGYETISGLDAIVEQYFRPRDGFDWRARERAWENLCQAVREGGWVILSSMDWPPLHPAFVKKDETWFVHDRVKWSVHAYPHFESQLRYAEITRREQEKHTGQQSVPDGLKEETVAIKTATLGPHVGNESRPMPAVSSPSDTSMPKQTVPCFKADGLPQDKHPEFDRQLAGQEQGLNELSVEEYLKGREAFEKGDAVRNPNVARIARADYHERLTESLSKQLRKEGMSAREADKKAIEIATDKMKTLAALHNPDMIAGGKDVIGGFGDRNINSRIGAQWKGRAGELDKAAYLIPEADRRNTMMNAKLERCK